MIELKILIYKWFEIILECYAQTSIFTKSNFGENTIFWGAILGVGATLGVMKKNSAVKNVFGAQYSRSNTLEATDSE